MKSLLLSTLFFCAAAAVWLGFTTITAIFHRRPNHLHGIDALLFALAITTVRLLRRWIVRHGRKSPAKRPG